jgi:hypothetical protein
LCGGDGGDLVEAAAVEFARRQGSAVEVCIEDGFFLDSSPL